MSFYSHTVVIFVLCIFTFFLSKRQSNMLRAVLAAHMSVLLLQFFGLLPAIALNLGIEEAKFAKDSLDEWSFYLIIGILFTLLFFPLVQDV